MEPRIHVPTCDTGKAYGYLYIFLSSIPIYFISMRFDLLERLLEISNKHEAWEIDELFVVCVFLALSMSVFGFLQLRKVKKSEQALLAKNKDLSEAMSERKQLRGILPICAYCKKVRDDVGYWHQIDAYLSTRTEVLFSHGLCPDCSKRLYPELAATDKD